MTRTALVTFFAALLISTSTMAQDTGIPDSVALIPTVTPNAQLNQLHVRLQLWVFNDEELAAANMGFSWDNDNLNLDSVVATTLTDDGFQIGPFFYEDNSIATSNANNRCLFGGVAIIPLFPGSGAGRRLWGTFYFTLSSWDETDVINFDTLQFNDASQFQFVSGSQTPFIPNWLGGFTIIDPNAPEDLILSNDSLHFNTIQGGPAPAFQEFTITASTGGAVSFTLSENAPWLIPSPITGNTPRTIRVDINNIGTVAGSYIDTIQVNSVQAANTPLYVVVTLDVAPPPPTIFVTPTSLFFNAIANDTNPDPKILTIKNSGGSVLNWTLTNAQPWLDLNPTSGTDSDGVEVSVDITGLSLGTYADTIVVSDPAATNSPRKVPVTLSISSDLPIIVVDSSFNYVVVQTGVGAFDSTFFGISNGGGGTMDFWLEWETPRLTEMTPDTGTAPATVRARIRLASGIEGNDYYDTVWVYSNQAINSPVPVLLLLHYVGEPAIMTVTPPSLSYNLFECSQGLSGLPPFLNFTVNNFGGDDPMDIDIIYESEYFEVAPVLGTAPEFFLVSTYDLVLPVGVYKDTIYIRAFKAENNPYALEVTLNVIPGTQTPQIHVMDSMYTMTAQVDHGPILPIYFRIQNRFGGCMEWHIDNQIPWANIMDTVGDVPDTLGIFASAFGMTFGQYPDSFYITSPVASNSPKKMKLLFKVWRLHGDNNYDNSLNILDLVHAVDYFYRSSNVRPQPELLVGDCNCDEFYNILDLTYLVDYFFRFGPTPCGNPVKK